MGKDEQKSVAGGGVGAGTTTATLDRKHTVPDQSAAPDGSQSVTADMVTSISLQKMIHYMEDEKGGQAVKIRDQRSWFELNHKVGEIAALMAISDKLEILIDRLPASQDEPVGIGPGRSND